MDSYKEKRFFFGIEESIHRESSKCEECVLRSDKVIIWQLEEFEERNPHCLKLKLRYSGQQPLVKVVR